MIHQRFTGGFLREFAQLLGKPANSASLTMRTMEPTPSEAVMKQILHDLVNHTVFLKIGGVFLRLYGRGAR